MLIATKCSLTIFMTFHMPQPIVKFGKVLQGVMSNRTLPTTLLQTFCKIILSFQVIIKSVKGPDDNFMSISNALTLPMLRLLSYKAQGCKDFCKPSKPCHAGIHWKALAEYFQMSTHMPVFWSFSRFFASFCNDQISHQQRKG